MDCKPVDKGAGSRVLCIVRNEAAAAGAGKRRRPAGEVKEEGYGPYD